MRSGADPNEAPKPSINQFADAITTTDLDAILNDDQDRSGVALRAQPPARGTGHSGAARRQARLLRSAHDQPPRRRRCAAGRGGGNRPHSSASGRSTGWSRLFALSRRWWTPATWARHSCWSRPFLGRGWTPNMPADWWGCAMPATRRSSWSAWGVSPSACCNGWPARLSRSRHMAARPAGPARAITTR